MSNIDFNSINAGYPEDGIDNSTQGFRDNFSVIKANFQFASTEITELQNSSVRTDTNNNFNGNSLIDVNLLKSTEQVNLLGLQGIENNYNISFEFGSVHTLRLNASVNLNFTDWPVGRYAKMKIILFGDGTSRAVTWTTENGTVKKESTFPIQVAVNSLTDPKVVEAWSYNGGTTVYLKYLGEYI